MYHRQFNKLFCKHSSYRIWLRLCCTPWISLQAHVTARTTRDEIWMASYKQSGLDSSQNFHLNKWFFLRSTRIQSLYCLYWGENPENVEGYNITTVWRCWWGCCDTVVHPVCLRRPIRTASKPLFVRRLFP